MTEPVRDVPSWPEATAFRREAEEQAGERRAWVCEALRRIEADRHRSSDTHLLRLDLPRFPGVALYLKDESSHPTGSLKHRLARSLLVYALCNGWIGPDTVLVEASSGSTAVSEAYFARLLGLRFIAVVPATTAAAKLAAIRFHGGELLEVENPRAAYAVAQRTAAETGGLYLDQFTHAERAIDWREDNIAESIFLQLEREEHPVPAWIVCGAGTGGTCATIGRHVRYRRHPTRLCVADPVHSVFHRHFVDCETTVLADGNASFIEGIGRPRVEPSFVPSLVDRMIAVADGESIGAMRALSEVLGRRVGGSTGTNVWACAQLACEMAAAGTRAGIVTVLCDGGERYGDTLYDDDWLTAHDVDWRPAARRVHDFLGA